MNDLMRHLAPLSDAAWEEIEDEAISVLKLTFAARKLVDFSGPLGWHTGAIDLGRTDALTAELGAGIEARLRKTQPLVELQVPFELSRDEMGALDRGAKDADIGTVTRAARAMALAEDRAVFHGYAAAGITGICEAAADAALTVTTDYEAYPAIVAEAVSNMKAAGVAGPFAIALGPRCYEGLSKTVDDGVRMYELVERLLDGPVIWAPGVDGAVVVSMRGGDFELSIGRDVSIGYRGHDARAVQLYLQESLTFRVLSPEAAVPLTYATERRSRQK